MEIVLGVLVTVMIGVGLVTRLWACASMWPATL